jgi:hypothetical protein
MPKKVYRSRTNDAKAQIAIMDVMAQVGQPLRANTISEMADIAIHSVYDALEELLGICVEKKKDAIFTVKAKSLYGINDNVLFDDNFSEDDNLRIILLKQEFQL